jgi:hypothetical protein
MAPVTDPRVAQFQRDHLPGLRARYAPLRVIVFGSRARGDALSTSDLDLILVSPRFAGVPVLGRPAEVPEALDFPGGIEPLCYTPEEFEARRAELGLVRVAVAEGFELPAA